MRILFGIAIILLTAIAAKSQYKYTPAYYPVDIEVSAAWAPIVAPIEYGSARQSFWQRNKKGLLVEIIQIGAVILDASGDAVYDMGKESGNSTKMFWGHTMQGLAIGGAASATAALAWQGSWKDGVRFAVGYLGNRYALFDLSYNITRGIDPLYADGVKAKMPPAGIVFTQSLALGFSFVWNIQEIF